MVFTIVSLGFTELVGLVKMQSIGFFSIQNKQVWIIQNKFSLFIKTGQNRKGFFKL